MGGERRCGDLRGNPELGRRLSWLQQWTKCKNGWEIERISMREPAARMVAPSCFSILFGGFGDIVSKEKLHRQPASDHGISPSGGKWTRRMILGKNGDKPTLPLSGHSGLRSMHPHAKADQLQDVLQAAMSVARSG